MPVLMVGGSAVRVEVPVPACAVLVRVQVVAAAPPSQQEAEREQPDYGADRRLGDALRELRQHRVREDDG